MEIGVKIPSAVREGFAAQAEAPREYKVTPPYDLGIVELPADVVASTGIALSVPA